MPNPDNRTSSVVDQSISTDSEESFLLKQINRSQLFNSSGSQENNTTDLTDSRKSQLLEDKSFIQSKRKSFFTESYIDENGNNRSFNVFQDAINESNTDESRDISLSGFSSLNAENLHAHNNALSEVKPNNSSSSATQQSYQSARGSSSTGKYTNDNSNSGSGLREFHLKANTKQRLSRASFNKSENHSSSDSARSSHYDSIPPSVHIAELAEPVNSHPILHYPSPLIFSDKFEEKYPHIKTPEYRAPSPPIKDNSERHSIVSDSIIAQTPEGFKADIYEAYIKDSPVPLQLEEQNAKSMQPPISTEFARPRQPTHNHAGSSGSSSYKSAVSQTDSTNKAQPMRQSQSGSSQISRPPSRNNSTRQSILDFELSRKTQTGRPHLLLTQNESTKNLVTRHKPEFRVSTAQSVGITPNIEPTPTDIRFPVQIGFPKSSPTDPSGTSGTSETSGTPEAVDDISVREQNEPRIIDNHQISMKAAQAKTLTFNNESPKLFHGFDDGLSLSSNSTDDKDNDEKNPNHYNDQLLEKIHYYRTQPVHPRGQTQSDTLVWILYLVSFIIPPLFFFLGFGLLDSHIGGKVNIQIKKLSLITGIIYVIVALAMIGVGFGVGITNAR